MIIAEGDTIILHSELCILLKAGVNVCGNVADVVLGIGIAVFQGNLHLADGIENGGMVPGEFLADVGKRKVGQLADQVHGNLPGFCGALILLGAPQNNLVDGVELADLADDQAGGGEGIALGLEHPAFFCAKKISPYGLKID